MALTGLQIFQLLPKTNCGECAVPTCMAFAMKLAARSVELSACPYASAEAVETIGAASRPPIRTVTIGPKDREVVVGGETVMFRHEKTFVHPTAYAVAFYDDTSRLDLGHLTADTRAYCLERVGEELRLDLALVENFTGETGPFVETVKTAAGGTGRPLILMSESPEALQAALEAVPGQRPLLYAATEQNTEAIAALAKAHDAPVVAKADSLDALAALTTKLEGLGVEQIVLRLDADNPAAALQYNTIIRKAALKSGYRPLGYPIIDFIHGRSLAEMVADVTTLACKYTSIVVFDRFAHEALLPLMILRQNIFTDPQKPIQVEPKIYPVGDADQDSPVLVTTNFSLTYFLVSGEIENSGVAAHLAVVECEGMSVLTAWAAGKFTAPKIAEALKAMGLEQKTRSRRILIPGHVAQLSGELEECMPGWEVRVGPQEAADIPTALKLHAAG